MAAHYDLFLSHNHRDKDWVRMLAGRIERETSQRGALRVFFDEWDIPLGGNIPHHLEEAIAGSMHIAIVLSPDSVSSEWVLLERSIAKVLDPAGKRRLVIPLFLHPCEIPASEAFLALRRLYRARELRGRFRATPCHVAGRAPAKGNSLRT